MRRKRIEEDDDEDDDGETKEDYKPVRNCEMHVLCLGMAMISGMKERTDGYEEKLGDDGERVHKVVSEGGEFKEGLTLFRKVRALVASHKRSKARKALLRRCQVKASSPQLSLKGFVETRASAYQRMLRRSLLLRPALQMESSEANGTNEVRMSVNII